MNPSPSNWNPFATAFPPKFIDFGDFLSENI